MQCARSYCPCVVNWTSSPLLPCFWRYRPSWQSVGGEGSTGSAESHSPQVRPGSGGVPPSGSGGVPPSPGSGGVPPSPGSPPPPPPPGSSVQSPFSSIWSSGQSTTSSILARDVATFSSELVAHAPVARQVAATEMVRTMCISVIVVLLKTA